MTSTPGSRNSTVSRRGYVTAAAVSSFFVVPRHVLGGADYTAPSEKVAIAFIGVGSQGLRVMPGFLLHFPARGDLPPATLTWYDGGLKPPRPEGLDPKTPLEDEGLMLIEDHGTILCGLTGQRPGSFPRPGRGSSSSRPGYCLARPTAFWNGSTSRLQGGKVQAGSVLRVFRPRRRGPPTRQRRTPDRPGDCLGSCRIEDRQRRCSAATDQLGASSRVGAPTQASAPSD